MTNIICDCKKCKFTNNLSIELECNWFCTPNCKFMKYSSNVINIFYYKDLSISDKYFICISQNNYSNIICIHNILCLESFETYTQIIPIDYNFDFKLDNCKNICEDVINNIIFI